MLLLIIGLILFVGLVVVHEFGHFIVARRNGIIVEEFGIGFPPRLYAKRRPSGYTFTINALPLGGFVKLKGEHDADTAKGSFGAASLSSKVKVMLAGIGMNLLTAFAMLTLLALVGIPKLIDNQYTVARDTRITRQDVLIAYVEPGSPAANIGLQPRDTLKSITSQQGKTYAVAAVSQLPDITKELAGQPVTVNITRGKAAKALQTTLRSSTEVDASKKTKAPKGYLGVQPTEYVIQRSTWSAPVVALGLMKQFTTMTYQGLGSAVTNLVKGNTDKATEQVSGPVGIFVLLKNGSLLGYQFILMIIAIISLTLALINILPIPALDGGRLFVTLLFRAARKPLEPQTEDIIHGSGFALLMLLFVLITIVDIGRF